MMLLSRMPSYWQETPNRYDLKGAAKSIRIYRPYEVDKQTRASGQIKLLLEFDFTSMSKFNDLDGFVRSQGY